MDNKELLNWAESLQEKYKDAKGFDNLMLLVDELADFVDEYINQNK